MKYLLACGGTAGHIVPALAIAEMIKESDRRAVIAFLGTPKGMENELVGKAGYPLYHVPVCGLCRSLSLKNIKTIYLAMRAPGRAGRIIKDFRPDIVIGTGGYVSYPAAVAAHRMKIPVILHESNACPGLSIRMSERFTDRILLHFDEAKQYLKHPEKAVSVGMPVLRGFNRSRSEARRALGLGAHDLFVLSFGGSLGAEKLNEAVADYLTHCRDPHLRWYHASGKRHYDEMRRLWENAALPGNYKLLPYIANMPDLLPAADIAVCRSGASTLAELAAAGVPAILIPSPHVTDNHQYKNASALEHKKAAVVLEEKDLTPETFRKTVDTLLQNKWQRLLLANNIRKFHRDDTADAIKHEILTLLAKK